MINTHPATCILSWLFLLPQPLSPSCQQQLHQGLRAMNDLRWAAATGWLLCHLCQCNYMWILSLYWTFLPNGFFQTHIKSNCFSSLGAFISFYFCIHLGWIKTLQKSVWISPYLFMNYSSKPLYSWPFTWQVYLLNPQRSIDLSWETRATRHAVHRVCHWCEVMRCWYQNNSSLQHCWFAEPTLIRGGGVGGGKVKLVWAG